MPAFLSPFPGIMLFLILSSSAAKAPNLRVPLHCQTKPRSTLLPHRLDILQDLQPEILYLLLTQSLERIPMMLMLLMSLQGLLKARQTHLRVHPGSVLSKVVKPGSLPIISSRCASPAATGTVVMVLLSALNGGPNELPRIQSWRRSGSKRTGAEPRRVYRFVQ